MSEMECSVCADGEPRGTHDCKFFMREVTPERKVLRDNARYRTALEQIAATNVCVEEDCPQLSHTAARIARKALKGEQE